jgi:RNase H-like domain found in reverse transcriptase/Reverse transcriptase (RNA-dependent DNA polymerase)
MYLTTRNSINVPICFESSRGTAEKKALVDSGATENFIDWRLAKALKVQTTLLPCPRKVYNMDGTENKAGVIERHVKLRVWQGEKERVQTFFIMNLGDPRIIFGYPWLYHFQPRINWRKGTIDGPSWTLEPILWQLAWRWGKTTPTQINRTNVAQEWAIEAAKKRTPKDAEVPKEYRCHAVVFSEEAAHRFPPSRPEDHAIQLKLDAPNMIKCKTYPLTKPEMEAAKKFLNENQAMGYIEPTNSPYSSLFFFIKKKDGTLWLVQDYWEINKWTIHDVYPIPQITHILEQLQGKTLFTALNIRWGYNNIQIKPTDCHKAVFQTPYGLYQPNVMYFGLMNSPPTFQKTMDRLFRPLKDKYLGMLFVYMDDILIATADDLPLHWRIVHDILDLLEAESFFLKLSKCKFERASIDYLGIVVSNGAISIDPTKWDGLATWPEQLTTVKQVRSTLGVFGYQRPFIWGFTDIAKPLTELTKKETPFSWTPCCTEAIQKLKQIFLSDPVLQQPHPNHPYTLEVDASQYATGAILQQPDEAGHLHPVGYDSQTFNNAKRSYDIHDCELLAVI